MSAAIRSSRDRVVDVLAPASQLVETAFVDHERRADAGASSAMARVQLGHRRCLDDDGDRLTVADDPLQLLGRRGLVDGNGHPAGREDGVVDEQPLESRVRHERDAVAFLHATGDEALGESADTLVELARGHVDEVVAVAVGGDRPAGIASGPFDHRLQQVCGDGKRLHRRTGGFAHGSHLLVRPGGHRGLPLDTGSRSGAGSRRAAAVRTSIGGPRRRQYTNAPTARLRAAAPNRPNGT